MFSTVQYLNSGRAKVNLSKSKPEQLSRAQSPELADTSLQANFSYIKRTKGSNKNIIIEGQYSTNQIKMSKLSDTDIVFRGQLSSVEILKQIKDLLPNDKSLFQRHFIDVKDQKNCISTGKNAQISIMQWNMLSQALSSGTDNFVRCPPEALAWHSRKYRILQEILEVHPDIVCMEEVDHFDFLESALKCVGYAGFWMAKPDSPALYTADSNGPDGCAMFYMKDRLELLKKQSKVLQSNKVDCNQVCIIAKFKIVQSDAIFNVGATHLKAKSGFEELRLSQGLDFLQKLKRFACEEPLVVCGDFNAPPTEAVIGAFKEGDLYLQSAYELCPEVPQYTSWKIRGGEKETETCKIIDYIWFNSRKISIQSVLSIPSGQEIGPDRLPCYQYPSDHFSLAIKLNIM